MPLCPPRCRPAAVSAWAVLLAAPHLAGCLACPKPASAVVAEVPKATNGAAVLPAGYWSRSGDVEPAAAITQSRRVVVSGFAVELVDFQYQCPMGRQLLFKPPPVPLTGSFLLSLPGLAVELVGIGRRSTPIPEADQRALTAELLDAFETDLRDRGLVVLPRGPGPAAPDNNPAVETSPFMLLNPLGTDTGQVLHSTTTAEPGLPGGGGPWGKRADRDADILRERNADLVVDVHLRVGTYHTKAALQPESEIRFTTAAGRTTLKASSSILSDGDVTGPSHFVLVKGSVVPVKLPEFARELRAILPKFVSLALAGGKK